MIKWDKLTSAELNTIGKIAERACKGAQLDKTTTIMDISAAQIDCPMRLDELLQADELNFWHDIGGISRHLDRETGQLTDCFVPRYAA